MTLLKCQLSAHVSLCLCVPSMDRSSIKGGFAFALTLDGFSPACYGGSLLSLNFLWFHSLSLSLGHVLSTDSIGSNWLMHTHKHTPTLQHIWLWCSVPFNVCKCDVCMQLIWLQITFQLRFMSHLVLGVCWHCQPFVILYTLFLHHNSGITSKHIRHIWQS